MGTLTDRLRKALHVSRGPDPTSLPRKSRFLLFIGSCGYLGYAPASGTVSVAVIGIPGYLILSMLPAPWYLTIMVAFTLASVWVHARGDNILGEKDSGKLVFDELAGYWIAMALLPAVTWQLVVLGFVLERGLDILKLWPGSLAEKRLPGGWGVVMDDVVAGLYTCVILHGICWKVPAWAGLPVA